jgi:hypothetical protein
LSTHHRKTIARAVTAAFGAVEIDATIGAAILT